jgi:hypothetical protein
MVLSRTRLLVAVTVVAALSWLVPVLAKGPVEPKTTYTFSPLGTWETHKIDVDRKTITSRVDKDGDTQVGAVFRVTMNEAVDVAPGKKVQTFVNAVIGICGFDSVLMIQSTAYDEAGQIISVLTEPQPYKDHKQDSTPPTEMYKFLCKGVKVTPKGMNTRGNTWT